MPGSDDVTEIGRLPLLAETARILRRRRVTGTVSVAVTTTAAEERIEALCQRRHADIRRVPMRREVAAPPPVRQEGDVVIIPVVEEEVVLLRRLVVTEEIHLDLRVETVPVTLATRLARQSATVTRLPAEGEAFQTTTLISGEYDRMNRTITAMFDTRGEADRAAESLRALGAQNVRVHAAGTGPGPERVEEDRGILSAIADLFVPDDDRATYSEGLRRGSTLVSAEVAESGVDAAMDAMEAAGAVDLDTREEEWRGSGWAGGPAGLAAGTGLTGAPGTVAPDSVTGMADPGLAGAATTGAMDKQSAMGREESIPMAEETLRVGKRAAQGGRVRVRSYVVETPVEQKVTLREERVHVERHAADRPATGEEAALFRDRTIEAEESIEEAVVTKDVRVTGEVVVSKDATEHTETIHDTVRRTEVDVDGNAAANDPARQRGKGAA